MERVAIVPVGRDSHRPCGEDSHRPSGEGSHRPGGEDSHRPCREGSHRPDGEGTTIGKGAWGRETGSYLWARPEEENGGVKDSSWVRTTADNRGNSREREREVNLTNRNLTT